MKELMQQSIKVLKEKVNSNLEVIKENQQEIKEILKEPFSEDRSRRLKEKYDLNKTLLMENNDFINVQLTLINFMDKYKNSMVMAEVSSIRNLSANAPVDFFKATVNGQLPFNERHPLFNDEKFFHKLMAHYQNNEEYEKCEELMKTKNSI